MPLCGLLDSGMGTTEYKWKRRFCFIFKDVGGVVWRNDDIITFISVCLDRIRFFLLGFVFLAMIIMLWYVTGYYLITHFTVWNNWYSDLSSGLYLSKNTYIFMLQIAIFTCNTTNEALNSRLLDLEVSSVRKSNVHLHFPEQTQCVLFGKTIIKKSCYAVFGCPNGLIDCSQMPRLTLRLLIIKRSVSSYC